MPAVRLGGPWPASWGRGPSMTVRETSDRSPAKGSTAHRFQTFSARVKLWACRFLGVPLALYLTGSAAAQAPARSLVNKTEITLPILLDNSVRPMLKEVQLFVKESPTSPWTMKASVPPTQTSFVYRAPGEGEYAFSV